MGRENSCFCYTHTAFCSRNQTAHSNRPSRPLVGEDVYGLMLEGASLGRVALKIQNHTLIYNNYPSHVGGKGKVMGSITLGYLFYKRHGC